MNNWKMDLLAIHQDLDIALDQEIGKNISKELLKKIEDLKSDIEKLLSIEGFKF